jgi:MFS family permease
MAIAAPVLLAFLPLFVLSTLQFSLPVLAPILMTALQQSPERYGLFGGAVGLGSVYFLLVNTAIAPVLGPVRTSVLGLTLGSVGLLLVLSGNWTLALIGGFLFGVGYATTTPAGSQILTDFTPRSIWGTLFSLRQAAVPAGGMIAGLICEPLATRYGWQIVLELGVTASMFIAMLFVTAPRWMNEHRPLQLFKFSKLVRPTNLIEPFQILKSTPGLTSLVGAGMGLSAVHGAVTSFFVLYLTIDQQMPLLRAGQLFAVLQIWGMLGRIVFGFVADKLGSPLPLLRIQAPMSALCALVTAAFSADWPLAGQLAAASLIGLSVGTWNGLYLAEIARLSDPAAVGRATAGAAFFGFSTYMIVPPLMGLGIATIGYRTSFVIVSLAAVISSFILILRQAPQARLVIAQDPIGAIRQRHQDTTA